MKDKTFKLQCVQSTLKVCKDMAEINKTNEQDWLKKGNDNLAFTCHQLASAYEFIAELLRKDLEDKE